LLVVIFVLFIVIFLLFLLGALLVLDIKNKTKKSNNSCLADSATSYSLKRAAFYNSAFDYTANNFKY